MTNDRNIPCPENHHRSALLNLSLWDVLIPGCYARRKGLREVATRQLTMAIVSFLGVFVWAGLGVSVLTGDSAHSVLGSHAAGNYGIIRLIFLPLIMLVYPGYWCIYMMQCNAVRTITADLQTGGTDALLSASQVSWLSFWRGLLLPGVDAWSSRGWLQGTLVGFWYLVTWLPIALLGSIFGSLWCVGFLAMFFGGGEVGSTTEMTGNFAVFFLKFPGTWIALILYFSAVLINRGCAQNRLYEDSYG